MKRRELQSVASQYCRQLKSYGRKIPGSFNPEDIHDLRVVYKRLRAMMRMLHPAKRHPESLGLSEFVPLYQAAGVVRDHQVFIPKVTKLLSENKLQAPQYLAMLFKRLFPAKEKLVHIIESTDFRAGKEDVFKHIKSELDDDQVRKFIHRKIAALQILLLVPDHDVEVHSIRKHLKDVTYSIRLFRKEWGIDFPVIAWKSEKQMNDVGEALGDYNDDCTLLQFLLHIDDVPDDERNALDEVRRVVEERKNTQLKVLQNRLRNLQLNSSFK